MKPRILFVDHVGVPGGAELFLLDVADFFSDRAHVILFQNGPFVDRLKGKGISVSIIPMSGKTRDIRRNAGMISVMQAIPDIINLMIGLAREARFFDVIYANSQKSMIIAALVGWYTRKPVIWHLHDLMDRAHFSDLNRKAAVFISNRFNSRVLINSIAARNAFLSSGGREDNSYVVYNGFNSEPFDRITEEEINALRSSLGLSGMPTVGLFSRLSPWKGQHVLLKALAQLEGVHAILVGEALFGSDREYAAALKAQVHELGIADRVHFLGFRNDVPALVKMVDVVIHASTLAEPFGRVVVEGMLARRPVIATAAGGVLEIIDDGETGILVPPEDPDALALAIRRLLEDKDHCNSLAEKAYQSAIEQFSISAVLRQIDLHLTEVYVKTQ